MRTIILLSTLLGALFASSAAHALGFPIIPDSKRIITQEEVKNYWVNMLPEPREPSRLARGYQSLIVSYHQEIGERHRLIQAIRAGKYDKFAKIIMLRHNIQAYLFMDNLGMVAQLTAELDKLEAVAATEEEKRANADRLERLIAATERLAAAIENNGGAMPANADQLVDDIIPFERNRDDRRGLIAYLNDEIALCQQPIIIHQPHGHGHNNHASHRHPQRTRTTTTPTLVHPPRTNTNRKPQPIQVVRPRAPQQPQTRPVRAPQQPQTRPVRAPQQPQTRPARAPQPAQVRPTSAPQPQVRQPQIRPAR